ncbi:hypothetical protein [Acidianus sp. HS-5]|uniref:hypothetical protein n=1 Tax=Acidianus sp. HS-5 TaxID=2886040 RepID=UPI001F294076|nr:hypothetical protein [Acidianus sp. HS-5]
MDDQLIKILSKECKIKAEEIEEKLQKNALQYVIYFNYEEKYEGVKITISGDYKFIRLKPFSRISFRKVFLADSLLDSKVKMNAEGKGEVKVRDLGNLKKEVEIEFNCKGKEMEVYELEFEVTLTNSLPREKYLQAHEKLYGDKRLFSINFNATQSPIIKYSHLLQFSGLKDAIAIEAKYLNKTGFPEKFKVLEKLKIKGNATTSFSIDFPDFGYVGIIYEV